MTGIISLYVHERQVIVEKHDPVTKFEDSSSLPEPIDNNHLSSQFRSLPRSLMTTRISPTQIMTPKTATDTFEFSFRDYFTNLPNLTESISVIGTISKPNNGLFKNLVTYYIISIQSFPPVKIHKRYSDFRKLHEKLVELHLINQHEIEFPRKNFVNFLNYRYIEDERVKFFDYYVQKYLYSNLMHHSIVSSFFE